VRFNDGWVPYEERGAWLLQADCAVAAHRDHLETRFAHRTRVLDCLWAGLPIVCTRGDDLAERIERDDLGATVPPEDPDALAGALARVLDRGRGVYAERLAAAAEELRWSRVAEPLTRLIAAPGPSRSLGARAGRPRPRSAGLRARDAAYVATKTALNALGREDWPRVR
jgi:glycosyltransferase involved in cell wall biosynthesis